METIKINKKKKETCKENALQVVSGGNFFERFVQAKKQGYQPDGSFKKGITPESAVNLREETCHILAHCNAHNAYNRFLRHNQIFEQFFVLINTKEVFWNIQALQYR